MSHATDAAIGMMDGAYFTSRNDILSFINTLLNLNITKIEQTASGAVACQLTEYIFPNSVPMSRVNWAAKSSHEYVGNYKLLQNAFKKEKIQKYVDVDKLIRGKYQDNLEFCQWLKAFFDQTAPMMRGGREGYDPVAVRAKGKGGKAVASGAGKKPIARSGSTASSSRTVGSSRSGSGATGASSRSARSTTAAAATSTRPTSGSSSTSSSRVSASSRGLKENTANSSSSSRLLPANPRKPSSAAAVAKYEEEIRSLKSENTGLKSKYSELEHASAEIEMTLQTVESERDFYFEKLRGVEVMLQVFKEKEDSVQGSGCVTKVMDSIFKVMYATMDDDIAVDDEGNLLGDMLLGDITVESSIDRSALLSVKAQDELLGEEEDGIENTVEEDDVNVLEGKSLANQFSDDSDDLDDDELLTSGLDDEPIVFVAKVGEPVAIIDDGEFKECFAVVHDDDEFSDEDLLAED
mmetsp:Transcript_24571/g.52948  ORF Transcript_24571/g.52948 Transcript_24571/m.52948 type:complete len:465 (-) Transcript_24571:262-1656(-)|eukprot:CAMPEP_0172312526 /NCGR_PEP_ID=MMETSP1058-20130122/17804_1 /TAXON_ID=83371 /ORGANISM="Detonula confervacea, Strain CCMP 353" /LENGTH=464 /DNA_ID=CAMNT_0013026007 /DNA_START=51 /DNA_END=1445 /DNA_ORIENTATION=+